MDTYKKAIISLIIGGIDAYLIFAKDIYTENHMWFIIMCIVTIIAGYLIWRD